MLGSCGGLLATLIVLSGRLMKSNQGEDDLVAQVNDLLPQTQCAQCGYPGCLPYAQAIVKGESLDLCPPGGEKTQQQLAELLGRSMDDPLPTPVPVVARIREAECIGCGRCSGVCPVDAIIGAEPYLHVVLEEHCTGCELCLNPCPVDCIDLISTDQIQVNRTGFTA